MEQQQQEGLGWNNNNNNNNKRNGGANSRVASTSKGDAEKIKESSPRAFTMNRGLGNRLRRRARMRAPKVRRAPRLRRRRQ